MTLQAACMCVCAWVGHPIHSQSKQVIERGKIWTKIFHVCVLVIVIIGASLCPDTCPSFSSDQIFYTLWKCVPVICYQTNYYTVHVSRKWRLLSPSLKNNFSTFTLSWSLIRNSCIESMRLNVWHFLLNYSLASMALNFKYSKRIFTCSRLKQVPWWLHVSQPCYSRFFTDQLDINVL